MKNKVVLCIIISFAFLGAPICQIIQPGQLDIKIYPGSAIKNIDNSITTVETELLLNEQFLLGTLCINKSECYEDIKYNFDLLNRIVVVDIDGKVINLPYNYLYRLTDKWTSKVYSLEMAPDFNLPQLSLLYIEKDSMKFYKLFYYKSLKPNYRPDLDVGTKTVTYVKKEQFYFVNEHGLFTSIAKFNRRHLLKSLGDSAIKAYLEKNDLEINDENDFLKMLETVYLN